MQIIKKLDKLKFKEYVDNLIKTILTELKEMIDSITHFPSNLGKGVENTKEELLKKANEMKTKTEKFAEVTKELFKDIDKT